MTLILTALCKNGICVCADRRSRTWDSDGLKKHEDNQNKMYEFKDIPLIIFNHGINKFINKAWRVLCSEYEDSSRWKDKNLIQIANDFKNFVEDDVRNELIQNAQLQNYTDFFNTVGFVLCGKTSKDNNFKIKEFFWYLNFNKELYCQPKRHKGGLIQSGIGRNYLQDYLNSSEGMLINTIPYWKKLNIVQAKIELEKLFNIAVAKKNLHGGDEFSDSFNFKCIEG